MWWQPHIIREVTPRKLTYAVCYSGSENAPIKKVRPANLVLEKKHKGVAFCSGGQMTLHRSWNLFIFMHRGLQKAQQSLKRAKKSRRALRARIQKMLQYDQKRRYKVTRPSSLVLPTWVPTP